MATISTVSWFQRATLCVIALIALTLTLACGGGSGSGSSSNPPPPASKTTAQIKVGDAGIDRIVAFEVSISSPITVTTSSGSLQITLSSNRLELSHMSAKFEPLTLVSVPQGTYTGATLTITNPELAFLDNAGTPHTIEGSASQTVSLTFNPAITIGASPLVISIDVNLASSVATDQAGNITGLNFSASSFTFSTKPVAAGNQQDDDGELEDINGIVTSVSGSSFTMNVGQSGAQLTFTTDNTTQFSDGLTNVNSALNQIVRVEAMTKADGTLFASEVEGLENQNGAELEGIMTTVTGNPASSISLLAQDGIGGGMDSSKVGASFTANVSGAQFKVDQGSIDTSGLGGIPGAPNFPFDATTLKTGQRVEVEGTNTVPASGGTIVADKVKLQQQTVNGTVANFTAASGGAATFDLSLPSDSFVTLLSGQTSVHVFLQPGTDNKVGTIGNTNQVRVRGLLFWTGSSFNLIARRITP